MEEKSQEEIDFGKKHRNDLLLEMVEQQEFLRTAVEDEVGEFIDKYSDSSEIYTASELKNIYENSINRSERTAIRLLMLFNELMEDAEKYEPIASEVSVVEEEKP